MAVSHHDATHNRAKIKHHVYGRNCSRWLPRRVLAGSGVDPPAAIGELDERCRRFSGSGHGLLGVLACRRWLAKVSPMGLRLCRAFRVSTVW